jgi:ABC-2 type transport system permease protein
VSAPVRLIARRELRERLRARSFPIVTALLVAAILAVGILTRLASGDGGDTTVVGVAGTAPVRFDETLAQVARAADRDVELVEVRGGDADDVGGDDGASGSTGVRRALEEGDADVVVVPADRRVVYDGDIDDELQAIVQQAWASAEIRRSLLDAGIGADQAQDLLSPEPLAASSLDADEDDDDGVALLTGTLAAILLFISLQMFGNYVLVGVVEEKASAVVELLLVRVRSDQLLAGKLIGIGAVALLQFVLMVIAGLVALTISGVEIPGEMWSALPMATVWFLGGYALYSTLLAVAGSLVSRQEDAQAAAAPILTVLIGAYILIYIVGYVPESSASRVLSVIPPIAPFLMPMRMAAGAASVLEITVALVLLLVATVAAWKLSSTIYEQVLLRRGSRIPWRDALALVRRPRNPVQAADRAGS